MAFSLYDASVANYLQTLGGVAGFLDRALEHYREQGIDAEKIVETRLAPGLGVSARGIPAEQQHVLRARPGVFLQRDYP